MRTPVPEWVERVNKQLIEDKFRSLALSGHTITDNSDAMKGRNQPEAAAGSCNQNY